MIVNNKIKIVFLKIVLLNKQKEMSVQERPADLPWILYLYMIKTGDKEADRAEPIKYDYRSYKLLLTYMLYLASILIIIIIINQMAPRPPKNKHGNTPLRCAG